MSLRIVTAPPSNLAMLPLGERLAHAGRAIQAIVAHAKNAVEPRRVYLFGSRATGTPRPLSDIDLAFESARLDRWPEFAAWVREEAPTLLDVDLVELSECDLTFQQTIMNQGVLLYER